ncbi:cytochrome c3 family protein [Aestuariivivens sediminis]|uniref:glycine-rich domain-containing protein n=1 Tax=Aestuariivivens sediminis TaxID=2913557 RepID=UPI0021D44825|nr:cytochrome c3 family protein [Aestuariivivens sediminis]
MNTKKHYIILSLFKLGIVLFFLGLFQTVYAQTTRTFTTSDTWTAPPGVTSVTVECWGAGGAGGSGNRNGLGSGGGGGGAYSSAVVVVIPDNVYTITVGLGGTIVSNGDGNAGGDSWFLNTSTVLAKGGSGGIAASGNTSGAGGAGGLESQGVGTTTFSGGTGGSGNNADTGGGGGSSAGTASNGNNGATPTGGSAPAEGGAGGNGGSNGNGSPGAAPGGAGGGEGNRNSGGAGADGQVRLTYTVSNDNCPSSTNVTPNSTQILCQGDASNQLTANVTTSGGSGAPTILYQWYFNTTNSNTVSGASLISGAITSIYTPPTDATTIGDRWYFCVGYATDNNCAQTNADQTLASNAVQVTVNPPAPIQPGAITGPTTVDPSTSGLNYSISSVTDATTYNWMVPTGWTIDSGQGTTSISVTSGIEGQDGNITVTAGNSCGTSSASTLVVSVAVASDCPISASVSPSGPLSECQDVLASLLTATVTTSGGSGTPTLLYQWYFNTNNSNTIDTATLISGATTATYTPPTDVSTLGNRWYFCVGYATDNGCGQTIADQTLASNAVQVTVNPPAPAQPGAIVGSTAVPESTSGLVYSVTEVPNATFYTWSVPAGWTINLGQNTNSISVTSGTEGQNGNITVYAGNSCGNSPTTTLAVISEAIDCPASTSVAPTAFQDLCVGDPATLLTATVSTSGGSGTPTIQYQWYYNTSNSNNIGSATVLSGATSQTYMPDNSGAAAGNRYYFCVGYATDNGCNQTNATQSLASNTVRVLVTPVPNTPGAISGQPDTTSNTSGYIYSITAVAYATTYTWTVPTGWTINSGQGSTSISVTSGADGENGNITVTASNACGTSSAATLVVTSSTAASPPTITLGTITQICKGTTTANLPYTATTDDPDLYSITFSSSALAADFTNVVDAILPVSPIPITVPPAAPKAKYYATLKVTNSTAGYSSIGYSIVIDVNDIPPTPSIFGNATVPQNSTGFKYSASASGATSFTWVVPSGFTITAGQGTSQITVDTGSAQAGADITVTATNSCGTSASGSKTVVISVATNHTYYNCTSCHITHNSPGMNLTNVAGNDNLCQSCHTSTGAASAKPLTDADNISTYPATGDSHAWNVNAVNPSKETNIPSNSQMALRIISSQIICSTCHNQHNTSEASPHLRASNVGDAMCKDCHSVRDVGIYNDSPSTNRGSHPVGVTYNGGDSRFNAAPTNTQLVNSKVECSSCHGVHDVTGSLGLAANGNLLRTTNDASLCTDCHTYGTHNGMDCLDCHEVHNTVDLTVDNNIYMIKSTITTPVSGDKSVIFTARLGNNSFADGLGLDNPEKFNGICEVCHDPAYDATPLSHFLNDGSASDQYHTSQGAGIPGQTCTNCHPHSSNFSPSGGGCTSCHETNAPTFTSAVHVRHKDDYEFACATCHFGHGSGGADEGGTHPSGTIDIVFDPNGLATRNGLDANTPTWSGTATKTCSTIYCHSNGRSAYRGTDGTYTWSGTIGSQPATYATIPTWNSGTSISCGVGPNDGSGTWCHEGPSEMESVVGSPYIINDTDYSGLITTNAQYPDTGSHAPNRGAHYSNSQNFQAPTTLWTQVQCFWCHNNDGGATPPKTDKLQGTYGSSLHVDGATYFRPGWYSNGGTMVNDLTYSYEGSAAHCGNGKTCW